MSSDIRTVSLTIPLPMRTLGNEKKAITEKLNGLISRYVPEVDGVLLKWSDLNILNENGIFLEDQPYVFWKTNFTAKVFKPIDGKLVKGRVNRVLKSYFIVKSMDTFTVTVAIPESLMDNDVVQGLMVDQEVYFKIKCGAESNYRGELDEECIELIRGVIKEESDKDVYEYAKDFEY